MSQSTSRLVLTRARGMIENPAHWIQGAWKLPIEGGGFRRCAYQAVHDAALELGLPDTAALKALTKVAKDARAAPRRAIPAFNDRSSHADVMALFDLAIEAV